jgi:hypothetical protein
VYVNKREKQKCNERLKERKVEGNKMKNKGSKGRYKGRNKMENKGRGRRLNDTGK